MPSTWTHPELGTFEFDHGWNKELSVPAFNLFRYASWNRRPDAFPELSFVVPHEHVLPSAEAIGLALAVLTNQTSLARAVSASMWDELNGRGPETGMWWHGIVKGRWGDWQGGPIPEKEEELWEIMRLDSIVIGEGLFPMRRGKVLIDLCFAAAFEEEHGVGFLSDGNEILGIGYFAEADPFTEGTKGVGE